MDRTRIGTEEIVAGGAGLVLLLSLFLNWVAGLNAWQLFRLVDIILFLIAVLVVGLVAAQAAGAQLPVGASPALLLAGGGAVALVISLAFLLESTSPRIGIFLAALASAGIAYGGWSAARRAPRTPAAGRPTAGPPPPGAGPPGGPPPGAGGVRRPPP